MDTRDYKKPLGYEEYRPDDQHEEPGLGSWIKRNPWLLMRLFMVLVSLAAVLIAGSFTRVGVQPILTDMGAPREDSGAWNDQFELGKVLIFAVTRERRLIRPLRESIQGSEGSYFIVDRRLEPRAVAQASIHRAGQGERQSVARPKEA